MKRRKLPLHLRPKMVQALEAAQTTWDLRDTPAPFVPQLVVYNQPAELEPQYRKELEPVADTPIAVRVPDEALEVASLPETLEIPDNALEALPEGAEARIPTIDTTERPPEGEHRLRADAKIAKAQAEAVQLKRKQQQVSERLGEAG